MAGLLSEATIADIKLAMERYPEKRSASIAALRAAQYQLGWLSPEAVAEVGTVMDLDSNGLYQLVTFYDMFYAERVGSYVLGVCNNLSCYLNGSDSLLEHLQARLGIRPGETTSDGVFTLRTVECLAACGNAPAMMVNEEYHERLKHEDVDRLLEELRAKVRGNGHEVEGNGAARQSSPASGAWPMAGRPQEPTSDDEDVESRWQ